MAARHISYRLTYQVPAATRLDAILGAAAKLRNGVRFLELVYAAPAFGGWWNVEMRVEETIGVDDPPEPVWEMPEGADPITAAKGDLQRWGP